jgi:hydroxymethylpyrimidine pyrophosphatase-like HAD family hydrolase
MEKKPGTQRPIECVEISISRTSFETNDFNLHVAWTLSVYALDRSSSAKTSERSGSAIYHFMLYDWRKTLQQLLHDHQVMYTVRDHYLVSNIYENTGKKIPLATEDGGRLYSPNGGESFDFESVNHRDTQPV